MSQGFFFENPLVRQAFNHALNRDLIWNELEEGARFPANLGVLPPAMPASTPSITYPYDLERANELLTEAGFPPVDENDWTKGRVGFPEIKMQVLAALQSELSIPVLQEDLRKLGITLTIEVEEGATYWSHLEEDDVIFFISGWAAGLVDPSDTLDYLFYEGRDSTEYSNPEVNALLDAARVEYDEEARTALYQQAHDLIMADAPVIPSAYSKVIWLQKPWIRDFNPGGGGTYTAPLWLVSVVR
jgi:ABC-type dipeptide transport system, periplasmic component